MPVGAHAVRRSVLAGTLAAALLLSGCTGSATTLPSSVTLTPGGSFVGTLPAPSGDASGPSLASAGANGSVPPTGLSALASPLGLSTPRRTATAAPPPGSQPPDSTGGSPSSETLTGPIAPTSLSAPTSPSAPASPTRPTTSAQGSLPSLPSTSLPPASSGPGGSTPASRSASTGAPPVTVATSGLSAQEVADRTAIEQAWLHYWDVYLKFYDATPAQRVQLLKGVTTEPQTSKLIESGLLADKEKARTRGNVRHRFYWGPPVDGQDLAVVGDCMDTSKYGSYFVATGKQRSAGIPRANIRIIMKRSGPSGWLIEKIETHEQPC